MPFKQLTKYRNTAQYTDFKGHSIAYWQHQHSNNAAEIILFIHGFPSAAWDWHDQWEFFADSYSMLAIDMLGFGLSDKPVKHQYSVLEQAEIIESLCTELGIKRVNIVAHDYGDSVAQELLSRYKEGTLAVQIDRLCWLNGGLFAESHRPIFTQKLLHSWVGPLLAKVLSKRTLRKGFIKIFGPKTPPKEEELTAIWSLLEHNKGPRVLPKILDYLDERQVHRNRWVETMQYYAASAQVRMLFINGLHDPISGEHMLHQFRQLLPGVQTLELDVGHYPQLEAPNEVNQGIKTFLELP